MLRRERMSAMSEENARAEMVRKQIIARQVHDPHVLEVISRIPRELFVPEPLRSRAYEDHPQPIGHNQTISQPYMVAYMTELLQLSGEEKTLEIGTGSGYQTAVLAELCKRVISLERIPELAEEANQRLIEMGYCNVRVIVCDGSGGYPQEAPYDRIIVTAASPHIPSLLLDQLANGGRMVIPVGEENVQMLMCVEKSETGEITTHDCGQCVFVPLVGRYGWGALRNKGREPEN
jgi:protein-L-isoaspartate(D-aspartate) O-methyltransferase